MRAVASPCASELTTAVGALKTMMRSDSVIVAGTGLALGIIGGGFFIGYRMYENYHQKLHEDEISLINDLHLRHLTKILVNENGALLEFPAIFQKRVSGEGWDSMHLNNDEVKSLGKNAAKIPDEKELNIYRDSISNALNDLKAYYFSHKEEERTGLTCLVLTYLMHILEKLLRFEGFAYDIAYLDGIMKFIHYYAKSRGEISEDGSPTRHYAKLSPVYDYLKTAKQELETHYATRSQLMILKELRGDCSQASLDGIKKLARFVTADEEAIAFANPDRLAENILHPVNVTRFLWKSLSKKEAASGLPPSHVTTWLMILSDYWRDSRNPEMLIKDIVPLSRLSVPPELSEEETQHLICLFFSDKSFSDKRQLKAAKTKLLEALSGYSKLLQLEISMISLCNEIETVIENRGMLEVNNPAHCQELYRSLGELRDQIAVQTASLKKQFNMLDNYRKGMRPQEDFLNDLKRSLDIIQKDVHDNVEAMFECRRNFKKCQAKWKVEQQDVREFIHAIGVACELPSSIGARSISEGTDMPSSSKDSVTPPSSSASLWYQRRPTTPPTAPQLMPPPPSRRAMSSTGSSHSVVVPYHRGQPSMVGSSPRSVLSMLSEQKRKQEDFMILFESTVKARASYHPSIQLLYGMRDVLLDYSSDGIKHRLMRHHLDEVQARVNLITTKLKTLKEPVEVRQFLETQLHELLHERALKGTLKDRIDYLVEKCSIAGYHAGNALLLPEPTMTPLTATPQTS